MRNISLTSLGAFVTYRHETVLSFRIRDERAASYEAVTSSLRLQQVTPLSQQTVRRLVAEAVRLNAQLGDPTAKQTAA